MYTLTVTFIKIHFVNEMNELSHRKNSYVIIYLIFLYYILFRDNGVYNVSASAFNKQVGIRFYYMHIAESRFSYKGVKRNSIYARVKS